MDLQVCFKSLSFWNILQWVPLCHPEALHLLRKRESLSAAAWDFSPSISSLTLHTPACLAPSPASQLAGGREPITKKTPAAAKHCGTFSPYHQQPHSNHWGQRLHSSACTQERGGLEAAWELRIWPQGEETPGGEKARRTWPEGLPLSIRATILPQLQVSLCLLPKCHGQTVQTFHPREDSGCISRRSWGREAFWFQGSQSGHLRNLFVRTSPLTPWSQDWWAGTCPP